MALVADFSATPIEGLTPLIVNFIDLSLVGPISWDWDFGDGSLHSILQNPSHTYTAPGSYPVTLIVSDGIDTETLLRNEYIKVYNTHETLVPSTGGGFTRHQGPSLIFD